MRSPADPVQAEYRDCFESPTEDAPPAEPAAVTRGDHYWLRLPATGLCFLVFGLAGLVLGIVVLPAIRLSGLMLGRDPRQARHAARRVVGAGLRLFAGFMRGVGVLSFEFPDHGRLGRPGQMLVANHPTLIDVVFLLGFVPTASCIVKSGLFANLVTRGAVRAAGYIPNAPTDEMIHTAQAALQAGETLLMFPEGTRTVPGQPPALQRGAANVALRAARVLTPVFISCEPPTLSKNLPWYRIPPRRPRFTLRVGEDIDLAAYRQAPLPLASRRLNADLAQLFGGPTPVK